MISHVAHHVTVLEIFERYIHGNNAECLVKSVKQGIEVVLCLHCVDKNEEASTVVFEILLADKALSLSFRKNNVEDVQERVAFDLRLLFSYTLVKEMVTNYIDTILEMYGYRLYVELSDIILVKPLSIYRKISQYARMNESIIHFFGTPSTRNITLKTNDCSIDIFIDTNKQSGVNHYFIEAVKQVGESDEEEVYFVKDSTDLKKALKDTVDKL